MNYIELINNTWLLREQGILSVYEADLYLFLVHRCNKLGWKNPFNQSTEIVCAVLGISRNALVNRRNRLRQLGLIRFKEGVAKTRPAAYELCSIKDTLFSAGLDTLDDAATGTLSNVSTGSGRGKILKESFSNESECNTPGNAQHCQKPKEKQYGAAKWAEVAEQLTRS